MSNAAQQCPCKTTCGAPRTDPRRLPAAADAAPAFAYGPRQTRSGARRGRQGRASETTWPFSLAAGFLLQGVWKVTVEPKERQKVSQRPAMPGGIGPGTGMGLLSQESLRFAARQIRKWEPIIVAVVEERRCGDEIAIDQTVAVRFRPIHPPTDLKVQKGNQTWHRRWCPVP